MQNGDDYGDRTGAAGPLVKTALFTLLVPGVVAGVVPYWLLSSRPGSLALGAGRYVGILLMAAGAFGYFWCAWNFAVIGRGTPAPLDPPKRLVMRGPYRYVLVLLGESIWFEASSVLLYAGAFAIAVNLFVLRDEEPFLRKQFGAAYQEYCRVVPRWLPRLRGRE